MVILTPSEKLLEQPSPVTCTVYNPGCVAVSVLSTAPSMAFPLKNHWLPVALDEVNSGVAVPNPLAEITGFSGATQKSVELDGKEVVQVTGREKHAMVLC